MEMCLKNSEFRLSRNIVFCELNYIKFDLTPTLKQKIISVENGKALIQPLKLHLKKKLSFDRYVKHFPVKFLPVCVSEVLFCVAWAHHQTMSLPAAVAAQLCSKAAA